MPSYAPSPRRPVGVVAACLAALALLVGCGENEPDARFGVPVSDAPSPAQPAVDLSRPIAPADAEPYEAFDGAFTLSIPTAWRKPEARLEVAEAVWYTGAGTSTFDANVNVLVEPLPEELTIEEYLELSVQTGPQLVDGFSSIDARPVRLATGEIGGRFEYEGDFEGTRFRFLAIIAVEKMNAVIATYTNIADEYEAAVGDVEAYLLTLATSAGVAPAESEPGKKRQKQKQKNKQKNKQKRISDAAG